LKDQRIYNIFLSVCTIWDYLFLPS